MKKNRCRKINSSGFTLVELIIVLGILAFSIQAFGRAQIAANQKAIAVSAASQIALVGQATQSYLAFNLPALNIAVPANTAITIPMLQAAGSCGATASCLSAAVSPTNSWGAGYSILLRRIGAASPYQYEFLVVTTTNGANTGWYSSNGTTLLNAVSFAAGDAGGQVGYTYAVPGTLAVRATGFAGTWIALPASYPGIVSGAPNNVGGQLAYFYTQVGDPYDARYMRLDGGNQMTGNLNIGGKGIYGVSYGINNTGIVNAAATATNAIIIDGMTVNGATNLAGNTTVSAGNLTVTNAGSFGTLNAAGASTLNGSLTVAGVTTTNGDIDSNANINVAGAGDIKIAGLGLATNSLKNLVPTLVEKGTSLVNHGSAIPVPVCGTGGTPSVFVIPSSAVAPVIAGNSGYIFSATGPVAGSWTTNARDSGGTALPPAAAPAGIAIARTFCSY